MMALTSTVKYNKAATFSLVVDDGDTRGHGHSLKQSCDNLFHAGLKAKEEEEIMLCSSAHDPIEEEEIMLCSSVQDPVEEEEIMLCSSVQDPIEEEEIMLCSSVQDPVEKEEIMLCSSVQDPAANSGELKGCDSLQLQTKIV
ncbi:hypothetical protein ACOMHN_027231 [Nucella lapillus]